MVSKCFRNRGFELGERDWLSEEFSHRRRTHAGKTTGNNIRKIRQIRIHIEGKAVECYPPPHPYADGSDLFFSYPYSGEPFFPVGL